MAPSGRRVPKKGSGFSVVKITILALALIPALVVLSTFYQTNSLNELGERELAEENERMEEEAKQIESSVISHPILAIPDEENLDSITEESSSGTPIPPGSSAHFEKVRRNVGSEPMDGDWLLNCPDLPPPNYPKAYPAMDVINNWGPDRPNPVPPKHYHALCRFDYKKDLKKALTYRDAEVPFILFNVPQAEEVVKKWAEPGYLEKLSGNKQSYKTEVSHNNHFMYFSGGGAKGKGKKAWRPPTGSEQMTFKDFKKAALSCEARNCSADEKHYYFRITAPKMGHFMFDELPFYKPKRSSIFLKDPKGQRGIHCRFGMQGVIAENHYDGSRNIIGVFGGRRRYILAHPNQCKNMYLFPMGHPSGRHSGDACNFDPACKDSANSVDWSNPDLEKYPKFKDLQVNEVLLSAGDFMYLPTHWFHYIISVGLNYQCNTRSGRDDTYVKDVSKCGFK
mmetsp:Transcript_25402/g.30112  ORF Transcript_25402/g.30112 Transcript_25402/m.30112 type:complete len:452 (-) Transcript_25402:102-1457(-)